MRYLARECIDLGVRRTLARGAWEIKTRGGITRLPTAVADEELTGADLLNSGIALESSLCRSSRSRRRASTASSRRPLRPNI